MGLSEDQKLRELLNKIFEDRGFDFRQYKEKSLRRRLERRLCATNARSYVEYMDILDRESTEYSKLLDALTINVSEFFRDREAFEVLVNTVLPEIISFAGSHNKNTVRIWSAGCAGGEEPYSIAMLLSEGLGHKIKDFHITIYATDIDEASLLKAGRGEYAASAISKLPQDLVERYFVHGERYAIRQEIKNLVDFRQHRLILDEQLTDLDLVICRNVVIYFDRDLQEKVFSDFYRGLRRAGFLFLGKAETLFGTAAKLFSAIDNRWRIYQKF
ncbi:CheR family methyltransferase [Chloroflexota bacterium]